MKWFDSVIVADRATAREYLGKELSNLRKKDALALTNHLRKLQRREKRKREIEKGRQNGNSSHLPDYSDNDDDEDNVSGMRRLPKKMIPILSTAALVLESLGVKSLESLEGMSKDYEGITATGSALFGANIDDTAAVNQHIRISNRII